MMWMNQVTLLLTESSVLMLHVVFGAMLTASRSMQQVMCVPFASAYSLEPFFVLAMLI